MPVRDWDASSYHAVSDAMERMGRRVLERLPLRGDETVLDAGCGTGRVTRALLERLPRGRVIGVDASAAMIARARETLGAAVTLIEADLCDLALAGPVDAVFSTATFHWIADHGRLFERLGAALRPGGRLVAQCGGEGNIARVHAAAEEVLAGEPFASHVRGWRRPWNFSTPQRAAARLAAAGFGEIRTWLEPVEVVPERPREYLATITLGAHLEQLPAGLHDPLVYGVMARLGDPLRLDYVRLNLDAVRAPAARPASAGRAGRRRPA